MHNVYLAQAAFLPELRTELAGHIVAEHGTLLITDTDKPCAFAIDYWPNSEIHNFESINQAARILKTAGLRWFHYPVSHVRRATLIQGAVKSIAVGAEVRFPVQHLPKAGGFCLLDQNTLLLCKTPWKRMPAGEYRFHEDKINPPNRAYLKLWEALSVLGESPTADDVAIDLGASPGGWTWVLQQCGAEVIAVDKAPLAAHIQQLPRIHALQQSAFALSPQGIAPLVPHHPNAQGPYWLVADIACYPDRLLQLAQQWIASGHFKRMICTLKLQGQTDFKAIAAFQAIPNSWVTHLWHNKHELTWFWANDRCHPAA